MRIKLKSKVMLGSKVRSKNWVGEVDNDEAKALIAVGYAAETKEDCTDEEPAAAKVEATAKVEDADKQKNSKQK